MKLIVNQDNCIGCGLCVATAEELFAMNDDGKSVLKVEDIPEEMEDLAKETIDSCPVSAIVEIDNADSGTESNTYVEEKKAA